MKNFKVSHYPQIPCNPFEVEFDTIQEALRLKDILADYDMFQYENRIKPDYCNMTAILAYDEKYKEWYELDDYEVEDILEGLHELIND